MVEIRLDRMRVPWRFRAHEMRTKTTRVDCKTISEARIGNELRSLEGLRDSISSLEITIGSDWVDDPAVWTWLVLNEAENNSETRTRVRDAVRNKVRDITRRETGRIWQPYVRFRSKTERVSIMTC